MAAALGGCSLGGDDEPKQAGAKTREIAQVVEQLDRATRGGDYAEICRDIFSTQARERAGGRDCEGQLRENARDVRRPRMLLRSIEITGQRAKAVVRTTAAGQEPVDETLDLVREGGEFRVSGLGG